MSKDVQLNRMSCALKFGSAVNQLCMWLKFCLEGAAPDSPLNVVVQVLAVAGALAVLGLWTLSRRSKAKQAPAPSPDVPHEALNMGNGLGHRARARHSND